MGLAASQARLLSITSRLSDNELRSQTITNAKTALANKTNKASAEYLAALDETEMFFSTYDKDGNKTTEKLTATCLSEYAPLKNQYGIINTDGQIMVSELDAQNYLESATLGEFLEKYGVATVENQQVDNPKFIEKAIYIYGSNWKEWLAGNADASTKGGLNGLEPMLPDYNKNEWVENPEPNTELYDKFIEAVTKSSCWVGEPVPSDSGSAYHFSHILTHLLEYDTDYTAYPGEKGEITYHKPAINNGNVGTVDGQDAGNWGQKSQEIAAALRKKLNSSSNQDKTLVQDIVNLLYDCVRRNIAVGKGQNDASNFYPDNGQGIKSDEELATRMQDIIDRLKQFNKELIQKIVPDEEAWKKDHDKWQAQMDSELAILNGLDKYLIEDKITYSDKEKAQWYVNLWHRMNGASAYKVSIDGVDNGVHPDKKYLGQQEENEKYADMEDSYLDGLTKNGKIMWTVLEDGLMNSAEWLNHGLKNGTITLERVNFTEPTVDGSGLEQATWTSIIYTNALDISEEENEKAITKAEVKYQQELKDIEAKDKQYDNMIRRLDTEHNALKTEYDSIKNVINKNVERTLKMYS